MSQRESFSTMKIILAFCLAWIFLFNDVRGCFITNCPPAGKRSIMSSSLGSNHLIRECTRCGPSLSGRCYGPNICCSPLTGCNIGGFTAARCSLEAYHPTLCTNPGAVCGPNRKGICALNATCCTNDGCFVDKSCSQSSNDSIDL
ncbi:neurophysin 1-like [Dermatophagoides pteronyssinus]|uniref:neurophysin 1-like n=1 Tax=Dermatophagoides pteronyssinus TaxID=6956 RepID=UPI003F66AAA3